MTATMRPLGKALAKVLAVLSAVLAVLLASACGAGKNAQTSREVPAIQGVDAQAGPIALRDLMIPFRAGGYPAGSDVPLVVRMVNSNSLESVQLTQVAPGPGGPTTVAAKQVVLNQPGSAAGATPTSLVVPPAGDLLLVPGSGPYLVAQGITADLPYTATLSVRFAFSTGDAVTVDVPMAPPDLPVTGQPRPAPTSPPPSAG